MRVIVRCQCGWGPAGWAMMGVGGGECGRTIMRRGGVPYEGRDSSQPNIGSHPSERSKSNAVIGPILAVRRDIRVSQTCVEMRGIDHEDVELAARTAE